MSVGGVYKWIVESSIDNIIEIMLEIWLQLSAQRFLMR